MHKHKHRSRMASLKHLFNPNKYGIV